MLLAHGCLCCQSSYLSCTLTVSLLHEWFSLFLTHCCICYLTVFRCFLLTVVFVTWLVFFVSGSLLGHGQRILADPSVRRSVRGHSNSVIFNPISSKYHIWIAFINLSLKFEYGFCPTSDNQDGRENSCHLSISTDVVTLTQSFLIRFLPNFIYGLLLSTSHSSLNMGFVQPPITKMADKMAATYQYLL